MMKNNLRLGVLAVLGTGFLLGIVYLVYLPPKSVSPDASLRLPSNTEVRGTDIKGALLTATNSQGENLVLKIQDVEPDPKDLEGDVFLYTVLYQDPVNQKWLNICQPDSKNIAQAIPLSGSWDAQGNYVADGTLTFACTNSVLAKCVRFGYKPWKTVQGESLRSYHQSCTRLLRADYCGNGTPHTQNGVRIDIYDRLGIQKRAQQSGMAFEAAWGPDGAVAISRTRFPNSLSQIQKECPARIQTLENKSEDSNQSITSRLQEYAPKALLFNDSFIEPEIVK